VRYELAKQKDARDRGGTVEINTSTMHLFLFRDGTVLTVSSRHGSDFFAPIQSRLIFAHDSLRRTCDASLLVHAALDLTVDHILEVVEECRASLLELERRVLIRPTMDVVRQLHVLQDSLNQKRSSIGPIQTLVFNLRRYDSDRAAALVSDEDRGKKSTTTGYLTHKTKTYLADVIDHIEYILVSMDMFVEETENLINYTYNVRLLLISDQY
jgi:Mg2+ and Co2+ transporter CorA